MERTPLFLTLATAVLAVAALPAAPAGAAEAQPDLRVVVTGGQIRPPQSSPVGVQVTNLGAVAATGVKVTVELTGADGRVTVALTGERFPCELTGPKAVCTLGTLEPRESISFRPLEMTAVEGDAGGKAGELVGTVAGEQEDATPADNTDTEPVQINKPGAPYSSPTPLAADVNTAKTPVGAGDRRPLYAAVRNTGTAPLSEFRVVVNVPAGATVVERYRDCAYTSPYKSGDGQGFLYAPLMVDCHLSLTLKAGQTVPFFDPKTKNTLFHLTFGRNLPGAQKAAVLVDSREEADPNRPDQGTGPSFSEAVAKLGVVDGPVDWPGLTGEQGHAAQPALFTKKNRYDLTVSAPEFSAAGSPDLRDFQFHIVNNGPSDSGPVTYEVTAPRGTVLLNQNTGECYTKGQPNIVLEESAVLVCREEFPALTVHAQQPPRVKLLRLKITSTPAGGGKITVRGSGPSTESNWSNNTVPLTIKPVTTTTPTTPGTGGTAAPGGSSGEGGGLPITGAPTTLVAGAGALVVLLGAVLLVGSRRRRVS
ncbi:hypothetical protein ACQPZJ_19160 [Actinoplanes sp. CA-054009]